MGVPAREAGRDQEKGTEMNALHTQRRQRWNTLSPQDKQQRLEELRRRHQRHVELEMLRLRLHLR
jgi:hypothetical protein